MTEEIDKDDEIDQDQLDLENKFKQALQSVQSQFDIHLAEANEAIKKAVAVSNKTGIPFKCDLFCMPDRWYTPDSYESNFGELDYEFLEELDFNYFVQDINKSGWEHWNTSSLTC